MHVALWSKSNEGTQRGLFPKPKFPKIQMLIIFDDTPKAKQFASTIPPTHITLNRRARPFRYQDSSCGP